MSSGYLLSRGDIQKYFVSETSLWASLNYLFSDSCQKTSTYKFGLLKSILDNLFNMEPSDRGMELSYFSLFSRFTENYWNLITHYHIRQMRKDRFSRMTKLEMIFSEYTGVTPVREIIEFSSLSENDQQAIITRVTKECKRYVIGALYSDFDGVLYGFDLKGSGIWINKVAYEFLMKYKIGIEQLNYYAWAKYLEKINTDSALAKVLDKLELSTPRRKDLSVFRRILADEFEIKTCFYCGKKLNNSSHVDHVIPWSFIKGDNLWNFVLSCPSCNAKKRDKLPTQVWLSRVITRNEEMVLVNSPIIRQEFRTYSADQMWKIWEYAQIGGMRVYNEV